MSETQTPAGPGEGARSGSQGGRAGAQASGQPGRYQRSLGGLVGAMVILLAFVVVFIAFRGLVRDNPDAPLVDPVDYAPVVGPAAAQTGWPVAAPDPLPEGWVARSVRFEPPPGPSWHLGIITDEQEYVGIEQSVATVPSMLEAYVGEDAVADGAVELALPVAPGDAAGDPVTWRRWRDGGGDIALTTRVDDQVLLVVTTGEEETLREAVDSLRLQG